jgi:hypothetical protein
MNTIALTCVQSSNHALLGHPESPGRFASFDPMLKGELVGSIELMEEDKARSN